MAKAIIVGAVLYDPKVSVIWDIIRDFFEQNGCPIFNPHDYTLEGGGMKKVDHTQLAFKREADPLGLLMTSGRGTSQLTWVPVGPLAASDEHPPVTGGIAIYRGGTLLPDDTVPLPGPAHALGWDPVANLVYVAGDSALWVVEPHGDNRSGYGVFDTAPIGGTPTALGFDISDTSQTDDRGVLLVATRTDDQRLAARREFERQGAVRVAEAGDAVEIAVPLVGARPRVGVDVQPREVRRGEAFDGVDPRIRVPSGVRHPRIRQFRHLPVHRLPASRRHAEEPRRFVRNRQDRDRRRSGDGNQTMGRAVGQASRSDEGRDRGDE